MFFSGLFQRKSDAPVTTPAELAEAIGLSYDTYTGKRISSQRAMRLTAVYSCVRVLAESPATYFYDPERFINPL